MSGLHLLGLVITLVLVIYLFAALLRPEKF
jgi:K+-transporting ATPase KdpF subunit